MPADICVLPFKVKLRICLFVYSMAFSRPRQQWPVDGRWYKVLYTVIHKYYEDPGPYSLQRLDSSFYWVVNWELEPPPREVIERYGESRFRVVSHLP